MEYNPSISQRMHKGQSRQWKTYCCVWYTNKVITVKDTQSFHFIKCKKNKSIARNWRHALDHNHMR